MKKPMLCILLPVLLLPVTGLAGQEDGSVLERDIQSLKQEVLSLNRDLFLLEEELLFPASTQVNVFLSLDVGRFFDLDAVELKLDGKTVNHHLYTPRELAALQRGGTQRLFIGNLKTGEHELVAIFTGKGPHGRDYRRGSTLKFAKGPGTKYVELLIHDNTADHQPGFMIREWE